MPRLALCFLFTTLLVAQEIQTVPVASGLTNITDVQHAGDGSGRLFIVEQAGRIKILKDGVVLPQVFLNISDRVHQGGQERGLLGLAFAPGYETSGRFYVNYTNLQGNTVISRFTVTASADVANATSELVLLAQTQPFANHNGGQLAFGPDGYLYIGLGDGGSGGDPSNNAQNLNVLLGKLLRVDVESQPGQVVIPAGNPFAGQAGKRGEVWAYGLRNPWRFSFDRVTNDLFIADVGQDAYEELNFQPANSGGGENYGWRIMEGAHCFNPSTNCSTQGLVAPVQEYAQAGSSACSVTGGFVYRGKTSPGLRGTYIYGDYCSRVMWGLTRQGTAWSNRTLGTLAANIRTFGEDEQGEVYVASASILYRIDGPKGPRLTSQGVTNTASFQPGMVAGSLATAFAAGILDDEGSFTAQALPLADNLHGISVFVDDQAAPIYSIANAGGIELVTFQVPWQAAGASKANVTIWRNGQPGTTASVTLNTYQPGVFTFEGAGIVVHVPAYALMTQQRPLVAGEDVFLYAEGVGPVSNTPVTGQGTPGLSEAIAAVEITINDTACEVTFKGLAPTLVGVYQINFKIPAGLAAGAGTLVLKVAGVAAPPVPVFVQ